MLRNDSLQYWDEGAKSGGQMVAHWASLGFVKKNPASGRYIEDEQTL